MIENAPLINARLALQSYRVQQGVQDGSVTARELKLFQAFSEKGKEKLDEFVSDGNFTGKERAATHIGLNIRSRVIFGMKHNNYNDIPLPKQPPATEATPTE
jgi:hypothetical protein